MEVILYGLGLRRGSANPAKLEGEFWFLFALNVAAEDPAKLNNYSIGRKGMLYYERTVLSGIYLLLKSKYW